MDLFTVQSWTVTLEKMHAGGGQDGVSWGQGRRCRGGDCRGAVSMVVPGLHAPRLISAGESPSPFDFAFLFWVYFVSCITGRRIPLNTIMPLASLDQRLSM